MRTAPLIWGGLILACSAAGFGLGDVHRRVFTEAEPLSEAWSIVTPRQQTGWGPGVAHRGIHVVDGAITILPREAYASDTMVSWATDISRLKITLSADSDTVVLMMGDARRPYAHLEPNRAVLQPPEVQIQGLEPTPVEGVGPTHEFQVSEGQLNYIAAGESMPIGPYVPGPMEMSVVYGAGRVASVQAWNAEGESLVADDLRASGLDRRIPALGAVVGAIIGLCAVSSLRRRRDVLSVLRIGLWALLPTLVLVVPAGDWLMWTERLYMSQTDPWLLSRLVLLILMVPAVIAGLVGSGLLALPASRLIQSTRQSRPWFLCWGGLASAGVVLGAGRLEGLAILWGLPMVLYMVAPAWMMWRSDFRSSRWLILDLPSILVLLILGWGHGLLLATLWRMAVFLSSTALFMGRRAGPATGYLLFLVLSLPVAAESSIRSTYLYQAWDSAELGLYDSKDRGWKGAVSTWSGACGSETARVQKRLVFAGGSSTGSFNSTLSGEVQYFPELIHLQICAGLPEDVGLQTINYGGGDRNTFTIAATIDQMLSDGPADLFVLYGGVNDIFSQRHPMTRKERHLAQQSRGVTARGLRGLSAKLRLVSGLSLPFRQDSGGEAQVSEVPLPDAEENHQLIMAALGGRPMLVMTERVRASATARLEPYEQMQAAFALDNSSVHHLPLSEVLRQEEVEPLLLDSPHFTQAGHRAFAATILPKVQRLLLKE